MQALVDLNALLTRPDIWRGRRYADPVSVRDTGFTALNRALVGGGWPLNGLVEINYPQLGSGEWQLLSGMLRNFDEQAGYLVLVNPPALLCASALAQMGVTPEKILIIRCKSRSDLLSGVLEVCESGCAQMLLFWEGHYRLRYAELRKVQLASAERNALAMMMRQAGQARPSPAPLQIDLQPRSSALHIEINRQRGGPEAGNISLPWPSGWTLQPSDAALIETEMDGSGTNRVLSFPAQA